VTRFWLYYVNVLCRVAIAGGSSVSNHAEVDLEWHSECADRPLHMQTAADLDVTDLRSPSTRPDHWRVFSASANTCRVAYR